MLKVARERNDPPDEPVALGFLHLRRCSSDPKLPPGEPVGFLRSLFTLTMNVFRYPIILGLAALLAAASTAHSQPRDPHIGYLYPSGGRQGDSFEITVGGQYLKDAKEIYLPGEGVRVFLEMMAGVDLPVGNPHPFNTTYRVTYAFDF